MRKNKKKTNRMIKGRGKTEARKTIRLWTICYLARCSNVPAIIKDVDDELYDCDL